MYMCACFLCSRKVRKSLHAIYTTNSLERCNSRPFRGYMFHTTHLESNPVQFSGVHQRGLFRLCGSVVRTRQLRLRWDQGERVDFQQEGDVPTVASLLKLFLRELPSPLVPEPQRKALVLSFTGTIGQWFPKPFLMSMTPKGTLICPMDPHLKRYSRDPLKIRCLRP